MSVPDRDRREGLILIAGILVSLGLALAGFRFDHVEMLVLGGIGAVVLGTRVIMRPKGDAHTGEVGGFVPRDGSCGGDD